MGKYEPLARYLDSKPDDTWNARFADVERVLGFSLPRSAHEYPAWWANQDGQHSQTKGWREAGWETREVDLRRKTVRFERGRRKRTAPNKADATNRAQLLKSASELVGLSDENVVIDLALQALIQREVAKGLIELGGSDPNAAAPPRQRFS